MVDFFDLSEIAVPDDGEVTNWLAVPSRAANFLELEFRTALTQALMRKNLLVIIFVDDDTGQLMNGEDFPPEITTPAEALAYLEEQSEPIVAEYEPYIRRARDLGVVK